MIDITLLFNDTRTTSKLKTKRPKDPEKYKKKRKKWMEMNQSQLTEVLCLLGRPLLLLFLIFLDGNFEETWRIMALVNLPAE